MIDFESALHESTKDTQQDIRPPEIMSENSTVDLDRTRHFYVDGRASSTHHQNSDTTGQPPTNSGFVFGFSSSVADLLQLHPSPETMFSLWQIYLENVDPLLKLFHVPSVQKQMIWASHNLGNSSPAQQALMFSIYYAATASTNQQTDLEEDRKFLLEKYRFGVEQALARADFLATQDLAILQAFVLYLIYTRHNSKGPDVWTLTGLAIRIATQMGLHRDRDVTASTLSHYEIEMRRRLWWHIYALDIRTAEDRGTDPSLYEHMFSTDLPSNVNDADLDPNMDVPPTETGCRTEMFFSLVRFEVSFALRRIAFSKHFCVHNSYPLMDADEQTSFIGELQQRLEDTYLSICDINVPICFLTVSTVNLVLWRLKFVTLLRNRCNYTSTADTTKDTLFALSFEIVEHSQRLKSDRRAQRWNWVFKDYVEWDALAYLLHSVCERIRGKEVDRAWSAINAVFKSRHGLRLDKTKELRWQYLEKLRLKAIEIYGHMLIEETRRAGIGGYAGPVRDLTPLDVGTSRTEMDVDMLLPVVPVEPADRSTSFKGWNTPFQDFPLDSDQGISTFWL